jgi:hypothetical protein
MESMNYAVKEAKNLGMKGLTEKILKTEEISLEDHFPAAVLKYGAVSVALSHTIKSGISRGEFQNRKYNWGGWGGER